MEFPVEFVERFWRKVVKTSKCWEWTGYVTRNGYGLLQARKLSSHPLYAHRVAWMLEHGKIPKGIHVLHQCDNPKCVRVDHLFLGTQRDNNVDRDRKGRTASGDRNGARTQPHLNPFVRGRGSGLRGEHHPQSKLTDQQVAMLRLQFEKGVPRKELASKFGISVTHVYRIGRRTSRV